MKMYLNEAWMRRKYLVEGLKPEEIAIMCNVSPQTIYNALNKMGLRKARGWKND
jgi:DNA invertase Pin-like site-specific DNA recombinase